MKIENLTVGMKIRICRDPSLSIMEHGQIGGYKQELAGTVQKIKRIEYESNRIHIWPPVDSPSDTISFVKEDLRLIESSPVIIKPELFNPEQLVIK